jgi:hypothetical protein
VTASAILGALATRWAREVDPDLILDPAERERRAGFARRAFYQELAIRSAVACRSRANRNAGNAVAEGAGPDPTSAPAIEEAGAPDAQLQLPA